MADQGLPAWTTLAVLGPDSQGRAALTCPHCAQRGRATVVMDQDKPPLLLTPDANFVVLAAGVVSRDGEVSAGDEWAPWIASLCAGAWAGL